MPRKRTPTDTPKEPKPVPEVIETPTAKSTIAAPATQAEPSQSFAVRLGRGPKSAGIPDPFGIATDLPTGVRLFENRRDRLMAIGFEAKPSAEVIGRMKDAGYRWNPRDQVWVHPIRNESARSTRIEAERLFQEVCGMIRHEKGIEASPEIPF